MGMRVRRLILGFAQLCLVAGLTAALHYRWLPLGITREWEWLRVRTRMASLDWILGTAAIAVYVAFYEIGRRSLSRSGTRRAEVVWLASLVAAAIAVQTAIQCAAPPGYGLTKWVTLAMPGTSDYFDVAKKQISDPWRFWDAYPEWIVEQDALHVGTHPPGLFLTARSSQSLMEQNPRLAAFVVALLPPAVDRGFQQIWVPMPRADRAAVTLIGAVTLLLCAATVLPLYLLARSRMRAADAWCVAGLWPIVPAAILFQPAADTAYPFLATSALALVAWSSRGVLGAAFGAGLVLATGMQFSLVFLPLGVIVAVCLLLEHGRSVTQRLVALAGVATGFLAATIALWAVSGANPFVIWWWNQKHHARFYVEFPRSYWAWVAVNPVEFAIALGLPAAVLVTIGLARRRAFREAWATLGVLVFLTLSGRSLSEIARLWLPFMPPLLLSGTDTESAWSPAWTALLLALQTLILQSMMQGVYPV